MKPTRRVETIPQITRKTKGSVSVDVRQAKGNEKPKTLSVRAARRERKALKLRQLDEKFGSGFSNAIINKDTRGEVKTVKKVSSLLALIGQELHEEEDDNGRRVTRAVHFARKLFDLAERGNSAAIAQVANRLWGKQEDRIDVTTAGQKVAGGIKFQQSEIVQIAVILKQLGVPLDTPDVTNAIESGPVIEVEQEAQEG